jgi:8-oxo-dGTP pyrophosphatase MutT (NUDIX family)
MVDTEVDSTIIETSLREMEEELGIPASKTEILDLTKNESEFISILIIKKSK